MNRKTVKRSVVWLFFISISFILVSFPVWCEPQNTEVKNIESFSKLYGYVRFFYPGVETSKIDWNRFAIYGVQQVEKAKDRDELKKILWDLFLPIAPALVIHETGVKRNYPMASITPPSSVGMKPIFWQYMGYGSGLPTPSKVYGCVRVNSKIQPASKPSLHILANSIDASSLKGKEFKFTGSARVITGTCQFWFRVDRTNRASGFFDNMSNRPILPCDWKDYSIEGKIDSDAEGIAFGCLGSSDGVFFLDDFRLEVREGNEWKGVMIKNGGFEDDKTDGFPKEWMSTTGKTFFAVSEESASHGKKSLKLDSKKSFAPISETIEASIFDAKPNFGDTISKDLGNGLSCMMPVVLFGNETETYPKSSEVLLNVLNSKLNAIDLNKLSGNDLYLRLGDVVMCWNVMQHFYPYFDVVKTDWKAELTKALKRSYTDKSAEDFLKTFQLLIAALNDGHGNVYLKSSSQDESSYHLPVEFVRAEGNIVVDRAYDETLKGVLRGDIVLTINGVTASDVLENKMQYISAASSRWKEFKGLMNLAMGKKDSGATLGLLRDGKKIQVSLSYSISSDVFFKWAFHEGSGAPSKKLEDGIYYLDLSALTGENLKGLMPELEKARGIICDLRGYPLDTSHIISHLLKEKENTKWMFVPQVVLPDNEKVPFKEYGWDMEPASPHWNAKMVFITDGRAISYAESFLGYIKDFKLATIVGQPTAGTNGNINPIIFPGDYRVISTGMKVLTHDGKTHHGIGIIPDVIVERTVKGIREGRDEFFEKALEIIKE